MDWQNETVLITGGSGFFGSAFSRYLLLRQPRKLIIFSRDWLKQQKLRDELGNPSCMRWFIGDVRDRERLLRAFKGVTVVIHAAAIKCIDACNYNPSEALLTNAQGAQNTIDACIEKGVGRAILISTDKAVNPTTTYGATKALAERLWLAGNVTAADDNIRFSVCRYGNVCGSSGSVVPRWKEMIAKGAAELPVTDAKMTRFWMTIDQACEFVAGSLDGMRGGELFIPRLPSIRITDLAAAFGLPYFATGIRPNEKIHEELEPGYDSGNNPWFLSVSEIKQTIGAN